MLSQVEADNLLKMGKRMVEESTAILLPERSKKASWDLVSIDLSEKFIIDTYRGRIEIRNHSFNHRYRREITLARVCLGDKPHTNPDGRVLAEPHLHYFKEGFGVRFAIPLPLEFGDPSNLVEIARNFFEYCNVSDIPLIQLWEELPWN